MSDASRARRLLRPRWIAAHLAVAALVAVFVRLGIWQLDRAAEVRAVNEAIVARAALPVEPVESLAPLGTEATYRRAEVRGRYDTAREVILHSRSRNSIAGHHVLTPLVLRDGRAVVVDRGWVPFAMRVPPVPQARPPAGEVVVRGIVLPTQQRGRFGPVDPPAGTLEVVSRVDLERLARQLPYRLLPVWLLAQEQEPPQPGELPASIEPPEPEAGPHVPYAIQWFAFGAAAAGTYAAYARSRLARATAGSR